MTELTTQILRQTNTIGFLKKNHSIPFNTLTGFIVNSMPFWTIYHLSLLIDKYKSFCSFCVELIRQFCFHPFNSFNTPLITIFPFCLVRHWFSSRVLSATAPIHFGKLPVFLGPTLIFFVCAFRYRPMTFWY